MRGTSDEYGIHLEDGSHLPLEWINGKTIRMRCGYTGIARAITTSFIYGKGDIIVDDGSLFTLVANSFTIL